MRSPFDLTGLNAVVLGGAGLIGAATSKALAEAGANVVLADRAGGEMPTGPNGGALRFVEADASDLDGLPALVERLDDVAGGFDIWVSAHYPRTADWGGPDDQISVGSWHQNVGMQLTGSCVVASEASRRMAGRGRGSVINIASIYGLVGPDFSIYEGTDMVMPEPYAAIKGGIISHTRYLAARWGDRGVRVNTICPGGVANRQPQSFVDAYALRTPLRRMADPGDIAHPVVFLASAAAAYITGTIIPVDGGWTAR